MDEEKIVKDLLNWECLVYWCALVKFFESNVNCNYILDEIIPDVVHICNKIKLLVRYNKSAIFINKFIIFLGT